MDNISLPPPSLFLPPTSLITIVAPIPATIPRPIYGVPPYTYHGLPFDHLPPDIQSFLSSHGLDNAAHYDAAAVASVRLWLTDKLMETVGPVCEAIVLANVRYNLLSTMYPAGHPFLCALVCMLRSELLPTLEAHMGEHLVLADALVWADVIAREDSEAHSLDEALQYRWLQTQPAIDLVATRLVDLYEWSARMWMLGWRSDGSTTYLQVLPVPSPSPSPVNFGEVTEAETALLRVDTPPPSSPPTSPPPPVLSPPPVLVRPSTPAAPESGSPTPESSPKTPRSARRVAVSPPTSPPRSASRMSPGITQAASRLQRTQSPTYPPLIAGVRAR
ncbi:hypothetical protein DFH08DRAFT_854477 [Mycena albidolilacea]|uniref:Uncharacterized protein n=1 Tax=Mycena albidolilacea TaxID=1033008 RepID=A0AAD7ABE3_9AGAR|nr:hypothetical protein DFH08DRAFT_854477 [Mycena albidolilacea]